MTCAACGHLTRGQVVDRGQRDGAFMEPRGCNRSQPVAKRIARKRAKTSRKPLPWVATSCRKQRMVRRGSTVRVRQRALQKPRIGGFLFRINLQVREFGGRYGARYGAFRSKTPSSRAAFRTEKRVHVIRTTDVAGSYTPRIWLGVRVKQRVEPSLDRLLLDLPTSRGDRRSERLERRGVTGISLQLRLVPTVQRQALASARE
jgi:hypothetical protein